mmetsp:Transcript_3250/g.8072  ORF Transcript_3250/g.8072 Transcript_3250/m.8072 type:complete len:249 (-) Transcript_3250:520-1266(-)
MSDTNTRLLRRQVGRDPALQQGGEFHHRRRDPAKCWGRPSNPASLGVAREQCRREGRYQGRRWLRQRGMQRVEVREGRFKCRGLLVGGRWPGPGRLRGQGLGRQGPQGLPKRRRRPHDGQRPRGHRSCRGHRSLERRSLGGEAPRLEHRRHAQGCVARAGHGAALLHAGRREALHGRHLDLPADRDHTVPGLDGSLLGGERARHAPEVGQLVPAVDERRDAGTRAGPRRGRPPADNARVLRAGGPIVP